MSCRLKHLAVAAAIVGLATHVQAGYFPGSTDFESANANWTIPADGEIVADATVGTAGRATYRPSTFSTTDRENVLSVDNDADDPIICTLGGAASSASTVYADVLIKGYPLAYDAAAPEYGNSDKLLIYTRINQTGDATNLCVFAKDANSQTNEFVLTKSIGKDEWHRIVIQANSGTYQVFCDDVTNPCATAGNVATFYPLNSGSAMTSVAFAGSGYLDDVILSDLIPEQPVHTLTWDPSFEDVFYVVGTTTNRPNKADGSCEFQAPAGSSITLIGNTGYYDVTTNATAAAGSVLALNVTAPTGLAKFAPGASGTGTGAANDPYTIPDYATLVAMQIAVAEDASFRSACYEQTADITLGAAWPGIGIQNGKDLVTSDNDAEKARYNDNAFSGTYDGGNHTIFGFQMVGGGLDYCGFFNSTKDATIKNLKIQYAGSLFATDTTQNHSLESGATFVGVAKGSTLSNLTTVAGTVSCDKGFGGIVGYLMAGSTVDSCTNNVNMTSLKPNKCGGIAMIAQGGSGTAIIRNCQNNGTTTGTEEHGGLVGYVQTPLTIDSCESTVADQLLNHYSNPITVQGVNKANANSVSYVKHSKQSPANFDGLHFATVDGNVATFVYDGDLTAGNTYKVMGPGATAAYNFTEPGTISFNTALGLTPTYNITAADYLLLTDATSGTVKTYTTVLAVAQIAGGSKYASLQAAVDAATDGDTVNVLTNCEINTSLSIAKNLTVHNDYTIAANVNYAICIGATVSFEGTGKIERRSDIQGSAFCVGANETTRGTITAGTAGTLNFTGLTVCGGNGGNLIKLENGTVNMNGGVLKDGRRGIKADADAGSYTSAIVINGGTITNNSECAIMASAESATGTATVTINGGVISGALLIDKTAGTYSITIPGTSTAMFDADRSTFCESGYETTDGDNDGWYTVSAVASYPTYIDSNDAAITTAYNTWKTAYTADSDSSKEAQFVLNVAPATTIPADALAITAIEQNATAGWDITVECTISGVDLDGTVGSARVNNGYLAISYAESLSGTWTTENINITASANGKVTVNVNKSGAKFMKAKLSAKQEPQQ